MPEERRPMAELEYGYKEPERISEGHISIKLALDMINKHNSNREVNTPESLAQEYKLNAEDARHILKHFHMLLLQMPLGKDGKPIQVAADTPSGSIGSGQRAGKTLPEPNKSWWSFSVQCIWFASLFVTERLWILLLFISCTVSSCWRLTCSKRAFIKFGCRLISCSSPWLASYVAWEVEPFSPYLPQLSAFTSHGFG